MKFIDPISDGGSKIMSSQGNEEICVYQTSLKNIAKTPRQQKAREKLDGFNQNLLI